MAHICVVRFYSHNIVVDVKLNGLARVLQKKCFHEMDK